MNLEEFNALAGRMIAAEEFTEYCAALGATATYNVNRKKDTPMFPPDVVMYRQQTRKLLAGDSLAPAAAKPAMRYARPGERPPSSRPPGVNDNVIERFDAYARARRKR